MFAATCYNFANGNYWENLLEQHRKLIGCPETTRLILRINFDRSPDGVPLGAAKGSWVANYFTTMCFIFENSKIPLRYCRSRSLTVHIIKIHLPSSNSIGWLMVKYFISGARKTTVYWSTTFRKRYVHPQVTYAHLKQHILLFMVNHRIVLYYPFGFDRMKIAAWRANNLFIVRQ